MTPVWIVAIVTFNHVNGRKPTSKWQCPKKTNYYGLWIVWSVTNVDSLIAVYVCIFLPGSNLGRCLRVPFLTHIKTATHFTREEKNIIWPQFSIADINCSSRIKIIIHIFFCAIAYTKHYFDIIYRQKLTYAYRNISLYVLILS